VKNPLYLPQTKTYDGCAALRPCILLTEKPIEPDTKITLIIKSNQQTVFKDTIATSQMRRTPEELSSFIYRECSFPNGCMIMTGTGIVPGKIDQELLQDLFGVTAGQLGLG